MTRRFATYLSLISVAVTISGCATFSEPAVVARMELADTNADGIERATQNLAAKAGAIWTASEFKADADTIDAVLGAIDDGMETETLRLLYFDDVRKTRAALAAERADWQTLIDEFNQAAANQRQQSALSAEELRVAKKVHSFTSGGK